jgi:hypothetical protein
VIVFATWAEYEAPSYDGVQFPLLVDIVGWLMGLSPLVVLVGFAIYRMVRANSEKKVGLKTSSHSSRKSRQCSDNLLRLTAIAIAIP